MKAFQLLLISCLLLSIFCRTPRQVLACFIDHLSNGVCEDIYKALLSTKMDFYVYLALDKNRMKSAMDSCL